MKENKSLIREKIVSIIIAKKLLWESVKLKFKEIEVEFFRITHSVPDSHGISINTPDGRIVTTGDYKFDLTPIGPMADLYKMASLGESGVDLLIGDSTNALTEGFSASESVVDENLGEIFAAYKHRRIILATFASNVYRINHIIETCKKNNRKIALFGRSMETQGCPTWSCRCDSSS